MMNARDRAIAVSLIVSVAGSVAFAAGFWMHQSTQVLGCALAATFFGLAFAMFGWSRWILPFEEISELREEYPSPQAQRELQGDAAVSGVKQITRKTVLTRLLFAALGTFGLAALFPIGALGPPPGDSPFHTRWRRGARAKRADGTLLSAADMNVGSVETVFPEDAVGDYNSMAVVVRLPDGVGKNTVNGIVAFSKACTHAGCPVALYRASDYKLICPCHQSAFDVANGAQNIEGPADRPLPQLPIAIAPDGVIQATGDFPHAIGPGFWQIS